MVQTALEKQSGSGKGTALSGNEAIALAIRQVNPDVVAAYPITPQTDIVQYVAQFVADGQVDAEFLGVESEHSAMSACIGACAAGARTVTATSSQGLAYMWETLHIASGMRLPIVMAVVNRALSSPLNIHCDHSDSMGARDTGWIQIYSSNVQEAYDNFIQAIKVAEDPEVMLPVMVCMDGFLVSHSLENLQIIPDEEISSFLISTRDQSGLLFQPVTFGAMDLQDYYFEHRRQIIAAMETAKGVLLRTGKSFKDLTGRAYGLLSGYRIDDAEIAVVVIGSLSGSVQVVIDELRSEGIKAGMVNLRVFRPFPVREVASALSRCRAVAVLDRSDSLSTGGGPLFIDVRSALYAGPESRGAERPVIVNYVYGLGGRLVSLDDIRRVFEELKRVVSSGHTTRLINYLGVRE